MDNIGATTELLGTPPPPKQRPTISLAQGQTKAITQVFLDRAGEPVDLGDTTNRVIVYQAGQLWTSLLPASSDIGITIIIPDDNITDSAVSIPFTLTKTSYPGLFQSQLQYWRDKQLLAVQDGFLEIRPQVGYISGGYTSITGPLTIAEVRLSMRDNVPEDNFLLDDVEFSDTEIAWAINRPVDHWNESLPAVNVYNPTSFPYRYNWSKAVVGELCLLAARWYRRNTLNYSAGGVQVQDRARAQEYEEVGRQLLTDYKEWMLREKVRLNVKLGWGSTWV